MTLNATEIGTKMQGDITTSNSLPKIADFLGDGLDSTEIVKV